MADHNPTEGGEVGLTWITCSCGWTTPALLDPTKAHAEWAIHEQDNR